MPGKKLKIAIIGAGGRGLDTFGGCIVNESHRAEVVAAVDPNPARLAKAQRMFPDIDDDMLFEDWPQFIARGKIADGVVIGTMEDIHIDIAPACAKLGYHMLMEKPMAPNEQECRRIVQAVKDAGVIFSICHELRYTPFFQTLKKAIDSGEIGELVNIQHAEEVSYFHFAQSFVRGYYRNSVETSFSLLSKSCHDVDILRYLVGRKCLRVHSFGGLFHFRKECKPSPAGDAKRCVECDFESECPFSAVKIYVRDRLAKGKANWMTAWLGDDQSAETAMKTLETHDLGRCVYECDNDVADHQIVNFEYEGGITASFSMTGFNAEDIRQLVIRGTRGELRGNMYTGQIVLTDYLSDTARDLTIGIGGGVIDDGHGGGDPTLMEKFLDAIEHNDPSQIISGPDETLETHITTFAAERSRLNGTVEVVEY